MSFGFRKFSALFFTKFSDSIFISAYHVRFIKAGNGISLRKMELEQKPVGNYLNVPFFRYGIIACIRNEPDAIIKSELCTQSF